MPTWDYNTWTTTTTNTDYVTAWNTNAWTIPNYVTEDRMKELLDKIYKIIEEHTKIDISEEEFLAILEEQ